MFIALFANLTQLPSSQDGKCAYYTTGPLWHIKYSYITWTKQTITKNDLPSSSSELITIESWKW